MQTRQRLIQAALELFVSQGVSNTTTRQIANLADVNEVTLFRQFGNKHGLLLAVIEESLVFADLEERLLQLPANQLDQAIRTYASVALNLLEQVPDLVRSLIGEADQYPLEVQQALGQRLAEINQAVAHFLAAYFSPAASATLLAPEKLAALLNALLLGYTVIELSSESDQWQGQSEFLDALVAVLTPQLADSSQQATLPSNMQRLNAERPDAERPNAERINFAATSPISPIPISPIIDIPASLVETILQRAKKQGLQDYALAYVLFGAGLSVTEIITLQRSNHLSDSQQQTLQIANRQVPVNQWILGKRYGSYTNNPLTQWLRHRKDDASALFINPDNQPLTAADIQQRWQLWTEDLTMMNRPLQLDQAQQTWCVEMLTRGMSLEHLAVLAGREQAELRPYAQRAKEKAALEQATRLDRKPRS